MTNYALRMISSNTLLYKSLIQYNLYTWDYGMETRGEAISRMGFLIEIYNIVDWIEEYLLRKYMNDHTR